MGLPINQNWYFIPSCYNGRTSSLRISGVPIRRPWGVLAPPDSDAKTQPTWSPSRRLDFELEMGVYVSKPLPAGQILDIRDARDHIFGLVLLNDWSARDIQGFEMAPLGPFHSKGFGTTVSPWIVTGEALAQVACERVGGQAPPPLRHLAWKGAVGDEAFSVELRARVLSMFARCLLFGWLRER